MGRTEGSFSKAKTLKTYFNTDSNRECLVRGTGSITTSKKGVYLKPFVFIHQL